MKVTKKAIEKAVRDDNRTALFAMFKGNASAVYEAVESLMVKKFAKRAFELAYPMKKYIPETRINSREVKAIQFAKQQLKDGSIKTSYAKVLIEGNMNIYWASPDFGHSDYNKSIAFKNTPENRKLKDTINSLLHKHL